MGKQKSDKRQQTEPFQIRMRAPQKRFLQAAADKLSETAPASVGLGPFMAWASTKEAERILGLSLEAFEAREGKPKKG
jgi:hypothetical protein